MNFITVHRNFVLYAVIALPIFFFWEVPAVKAVVGDEEIDPGRLAEIRLEHQREVEEQIKSEEEERRAYLIRLLDEKKKNASGAADAQRMNEEIAKLKSEALTKRKRFKDRILFTPFERVVFDSNIRNQKVAKSDTIFNSGAGVKFDLGGSKTKFDIDYTGAYARYLKNSKLSRFEHALATHLNYPFSSKTSADAFYRLSSTGNQTSEIRSILNRIRQDVALNFKRKISQKTGVRLGQSYNDILFSSGPQKENSTRQYILSPQMDYYLSRKTSIFTRYAIGLSSGGVNDSNESVAHEFRGGIRGKVAPKTTALLDLGFSHQKQKKLGGDVNAFVAEVVAISNVTRKTKLELLINRSLSQANDTEGSKFFITENYRLSGNTQFRRYLEGELFGGVRRNIFEQNNKLSGSNQKDLILELGSSLRYDFLKWLGFELRYVLSGANSNESSREYAKHVLSLALNGKY